MFEEEENLTSGTPETSGENPTVPPENENPNGEETPVSAEAPIPVEVTDAETPDAGTPEPEAPETPVGATEATWQFGDPAEPAASARGQLKHFFITFGIIFGVCVLLLLLTLWLGENGFRITRTLKTDRTVYVREYDSESGLLTPSEAADVVRRSTVTVRITTAIGDTGIGSGIVYTADGYIITNAHVVEDAARVQVVLADGTAYDAVIVGTDADADIAVIKTEAPGLVAAAIGNSDDLLTGEDVVAIGTPAKLAYAGTATFGKVSDPHRLVDINDETGTITRKMTLIQTDTLVNPGNSGGPLADMYGRVVGVVVMKVSYYNGSYFDGIGFAIPIAGAVTVADAIIADGSFTGVNPIAEGRSLLGITGHGGIAGNWYSDEADLLTGAIKRSETEEAGYHYMATDGVYVMSVSGASAALSVKKGDIVTKINGLSVRDTTDLIEAANRHYVGEKVVLTLFRDGAIVTAEITLYEE